MTTNLRAAVRAGSSSRRQFLVRKPAEQGSNTWLSRAIMRQQLARPALSITKKVGTRTIEGRSGIATN
jgi:hypothetical protein